MQNLSVRTIIVLLQMKDCEFSRNQPLFFYQKGWIASNFKVKNNVSAILKTRQKSVTEIHRPEYQRGSMPIHFKSVELTKTAKPSTAPQKNRRKKEITLSENLNPLNAIMDEQLLLHFEGKHSYFKTTLNNRKPLLFIRPYTRNSSASMTIDERKAQIYREINNPDLTNFNMTFQQTGPIEYLTEYAQPYTSRVEKPTYKSRGMRHNRASLNILKQKLKRHCELTSYQSKRKGIKNL